METALYKQVISKKVIAISRGIYGDALLRLAESLRAGGVSMIEVTYDQKDPDHLNKTAASIRALCQTFPDMAVGAGTVITRVQLEATVQAGGRFMISPNTNILLIQLAKEMGLLAIPGAMTPSEIIAAYDAGADFIKLFPCSWLGPDYIRAIRSPINHIPLLATGGINAENLASYLALGMVGAGIGGKLCDRKLVESGRYDLLEANARACMQAAGVC